MKRFALLLMLICAVPAIAEIVPPIHAHSIAVCDFATGKCSADTVMLASAGVPREWIVNGPVLNQAQPDAPAPPPEVKVGTDDIKSALLSAFIKFVLPLLLTLLTAASTAALAMLTKWLQQKAQTSKVAAVILTFETKAAAIVQHVEVEIRPEIDKDLADGDLSAAERVALKAKALVLLKEAAGAEGLADLSGVLGLIGGSVDVFLSGLIEKHVAALPASAQVAPSSPIATSVTDVAEQIAVKVGDAAAARIQTDKQAVAELNEK